MDELSSQQVTIDDPYWTRQLETNSSQAIYHQWEQLETSGCIDNFRIAAGELESFREGFFFADSDAYKWLDAGARIYATKPNPRLAQLMDRFISLVGRAQDPDGYLFTYNQILFPDTRWQNLWIEHELYCHGHLIEAGVSHFLATQQTNLLDIARKAAERIMADFRDKGPEFTSGHEEIEIALLRLYEITGGRSYLEMAQQFLE
ncbi:MAG: glycoside hydrolase family 127 protein, partial [Anaerolineae bacterium]|nr:glycoside hydrolase family 127 protein [Anaerolineae bacterium]